VGVVGSSEPDEQLAAIAEAVGAEIAGRDGVLVCGGLGGVMEATCRGARGAGGLTVGILPGEDRAAANKWVSVAIPTGLGELRNGLIVRAADVLVAIGGGFGTLSEIALALRSGKKVIGLAAWGTRPGDPAVEGMVAARDPVDAVERAYRCISE
jgi:uncharacterized protein (TIGR00725 family)